MTETQNKTGVLRRDDVRVVSQPALVACGHDPEVSGSSITVVPLLDGNRVAGFEVRCGCGGSAIVECVYPNKASDAVH